MSAAEYGQPLCSLCSVLTVDFNERPVDRQFVEHLKGKGGGMWREVFIHCCHEQTGAPSAGVRAHRAAQGEEEGGEVVGLLQGDGHGGCG